MIVKIVVYYSVGQKSETTCAMLLFYVFQIEHNLSSNYIII